MAEEAEPAGRRAQVGAAAQWRLSAAPAQRALVVAVTVTERVGLEQALEVGPAAAAVSPRTALNTLQVGGAAAVQRSRAVASPTRSGVFLAMRWSHRVHPNVGARAVREQTLQSEGPTK